MWSQISLIIVLTFHLHACHDHNHSIHITEVSQAEQHDLDMSEFKVYRLKRREVLDPDAPRLSSGNLDRDSVHHSSAGAASDSGHGPGKNDDLESGLLGNESLPDLRINGVAGIHENIGHSLEAAKSNRQLFNDSRPISVISTVAVQELFDRYGDGQAMNIEGFQRLMVSLGLGNVSLDDEVDDARIEPASYNQESHDYDDESADHIKHVHNDGSPNQHRERRVRGTGARHAEGQIIGSKPKGKVKQLKLDSERNIEEGQTNRKGKKRNKSRKSNRKQNKNKNEDKSQQEQQSGSTDQLTLKKRSLPEHKPNLDKCMTPEDLLLFFNEGPKDSSNFSLSQTNFIELCPVLIHQLDKRLCPTEHSILARSAQLHQDPHDSHDHDDDHHHDDDHDHSHHSDHDHEEGGNITEALSSGLFKASAKVWGYAFLSCLIISVVGLASVAIVPIMHKVIYNHLLQFLVALAIGSLTGDAFLHLLPHAVVPHNHDLHDNNNGDVDYKEHDKTAIWIGCVALGGIYFFLLAERIMGIVTRKRREHNRKKRKMRASPSRPYTEEAETHIGAKLSSHNDDMKSCEETLMVVHPNKGVCGMAVEAHDEVHQNCDPDVRSTWGLGQSHDSAGPGHHHSHEVPGSVASVAWMVIVGDGLHNFSDGLAIGAAFANGLTSGLSTSIAVFCHELPHELGDFAVLLRAGMSVKQALVYNCVSSILCLVGMVTGIAVGNLDAASQWIFALISGMFIYIALVDMLPEITNISPKEGENPGVHLILQSAGIITGAAIMLLIAIYEDRIQVPHWEP